MTRNELQQRKNELQSLYGGEMSHWKETLKSSLEVTPEERMERIRTRAYDLNAKREAERKEFVEECYERQWRDACDDLRAFDSKATLDRIVKDRESMIEIRRITAEENASSQNDVDVMSLISRDESDEQSQRRRSNLSSSSGRSTTRCSGRTHGTNPRRNKSSRRNRNSPGRGSMSRLLLSTS